MQPETNRVSQSFVFALPVTVSLPMSPGRWIVHGRRPLLAADVMRASATHLLCAYPPSLPSLLAGSTVDSS
eukprot:CAMPEP_0185272564 /NCGR_PEP_ID=MMETSP1359-20130426/47531_1 /TAXON_ID=552665 /ORGANISM="Bigelowiella longifila, Strain CCMP242" /LENGTH=70 /DNA_ID=CAMNT_0027864891 /DNA_START=100 /DNA_END=308 /DNA_ORIENTATION=+